MRYVTFAGVALAGAVACALGGGAVAAEDRPAAAAAAGWQAAPEVRPGEIVIRRTGKKRVADARLQAAPGRLAELPYEGPGPRSVTIGYLVRDEVETGWGPQVHCPTPNYVPSYSSCDSYGYGYNSYLPSYVSHYGSSCGVGGTFFGSRPYSAPAAPMGRAVRWR